MDGLNLDQFWKLLDFRGPRATRACTAKVALKMVARRLSPGASGGSRGAAGKLKTAPRGAKSAQKPASGGFGAALAATLGPRGPRRYTPGAHVRTDAKT